MRPSFDEVYMQVVEVIARRSTCLRKKVGSVIVVDRRILSHGYNGVVSGEAHCCDTGVYLKAKAGREDYKPCVHAEQNAICLSRQARPGGPGRRPLRQRRPLPDLREADRLLRDRQGGREEGPAHRGRDRFPPKAWGDRR